jgi:hypothetical protein
MKNSLARLKRGENVEDLLISFEDLRRDVGFDEYLNDLNRL